jgi:hypothetical protein
LIVFADKANKIKGNYVANTIHLKKTTTKNTHTNKNKKKKIKKKDQ